MDGIFSKRMWETEILDSLGRIKKYKRTKFGQVGDGGEIWEELGMNIIKTYYMNFQILKKQSNSTTTTY